MAYYFVNPFGVDGTKTTIPDETQPSGAVSWQTGFTSDYQLTYGTAGAKAIPRAQSNELYYQITLALQQYQQNGTPDWITAEDNLDNDFEYPIFARVRYDAGDGVKVWENQVEDNTAIPGDDATWMQISGNMQGVPTGMIMDFGSPVVPDGYLLCIGTAVSRTTYANLFNALNFTQAGTLTNSANTVSGLTNATSYMYVGMKIEGTNIPAATTVASIVDDNNITMSANATGSGSSTIRFFPNGNGDGSTTFNIPDCRRRVMVGSGGSSTAVLGKVTGQTGGEEAHVQTEAELATHSHDGPDGHNFVVSGGGSEASTGGSQTAFSSPTAETGSSSPMNIMQPSMITTRCIKT